MNSPISDAYVRLTKVMRLAQGICVPKIFAKVKPETPKA